MFWDVLDICVIVYSVGRGKKQFLIQSGITKELNKIPPAGHHFSNNILVSIWHNT